jgi:hypothetical protein
MQELILREHITLLEIGLNRDGIDDIPSIRGWRRYLGNKVTLYGVDVDPRLSRHHDPGAGIHILIADQSRAQDLVRCGVANPKGYDVIIDGGSHMSSHQQITLRTLWQFLLPGGIYVIEHLHFQPQVETTMRTRDLIRLWRDGNPASTPHIQRPEAARIIEEASGIELHDSLSQRWGNETRDSLAVIRKQRRHLKAGTRALSLPVIRC